MRPFTSALGLFACTDLMPLSRAASDSYISLVPMTWPLEESRDNAPMRISFTHIPDVGLEQD